VAGLLDGKGGELRREPSSTSVDVDLGYIAVCCTLISFGMYRTLVPRNQLLAVVNRVRVTAAPPRFTVCSIATSMPSKTDDKYTDPELHNVVKEEIQAGDKGGAPGEWSARKV